MFGGLVFHLVKVGLFVLGDLGEVMFESGHLIMFRVRTAVLKADGGRSEEVIVVIQTEVENSIICVRLFTNSCFQFRIPGVRPIRPVTFPLAMAPGVSHSE